MDGLLIISSLVTAFLAGIAALFAPCCITVLLPAYLGSIFRQKRTVILMTFVFFLGLLAVFLPLGLGIAGFGQMIKENHDIIFIIGGVFLACLGISILLGRHFSLPFSYHPKIKVRDAGSVFILGIFSGFATLCCAPVLAGVLALSILPGSVFWGAIYAFAYSFGMVAPLFFIAYFLDKKHVSEKLELFKKEISYSIAGKQVSITIADIISGTAFLFMGVLIIYLAWMGSLAMEENDFQTSMNIYMSNLTSSVNNFLLEIPAIIWYFLVIIIVVIVIIIASGLAKKKQFLKKIK